MSDFVPRQRVYDQFAAIRLNPDTAQLQEWLRNQRGTKEFLAQIEDELLVRAGLKKERSS